MHWWLGLAVNGGNNVAGFVLSDAGAVGFNSAKGLIGATALDDDAWHYLVGVRVASDDADDTNDKILLYVDGALAAEKVVAFGDYTVGFDTNRPLNMGYLDFRGGDAPATVPGFFFTGDLDEVALFDRALSAAEIARLFEIGQDGISLRSIPVPLAADDTYTTPIETDLTVAAVDGVLANDTPATATQTVELVIDVTNGALVLGDDGGFTYTPDAGFTGDDTFTYKWSDGLQDSNDAIATITVTAAPVVTPPPSGGGSSGGCFITTAGK